MRKASGLRIAGQILDKSAKEKREEKKEEENDSVAKEEKQESAKLSDDGANPS